MRVQVVIPVIVGILILGVIGLPQNVFSQTIDPMTGLIIVTGLDSDLTITNGTTVPGIFVFGGNLTINDGVTVEGDIWVYDGGSLTLDDTTVDGLIMIDNGNSAEITNSTINGNIEITDSEIVTVSGNTVYGNIEIGDISSCNVFENDVDGNVEIDECDTEPPNTPPTIDTISADFSVDEGTNGHALSSTVSDPDPEDTLTYSWTFSGEGSITVTMYNADTLNPTFDVSIFNGNQSKDITFELSISDGVNPPVTDTVMVTVNHV
jgi:hypothetical protein